MIDCCEEFGYVIINVKNKFCVGDLFELMMLSGNIIFMLNEMLDKRNYFIMDVKGLGY